MKNTVPLVFFLTVCLGVSAVGGWITQTSVNDWYQTLAKPPMNPPDWVFAPMWITLYVMMAVAGWRVWLRSANNIRRMAMVAFAVQLMLNLIWSFIFFGAQSPGFAAIEIVLLWISILITLLMFWRIDGFAGWLMSPYIVWVSFAIYLNISIVLLN
jgi:benzodiazapine receptor